MKIRNAIALLSLALVASFATAQPVANRPLRIIVALGPGTPSDSMARAIAPKLSALLEQTVIVENKPGANGVIAMQELIRANPDGSTLLMGSISPLAINVALVKNLSYDPRRDITPVGGVYAANQVWVVRNGFPARTFAELVAYAKQNPGKVSAGHYSSLTQIQFAAVSKMAGMELLTVPYKSTTAAYTDLMGGTIDVSLMDMATAINSVKGGQVRALAVTTLKRNPLALEIPAVSETLPGSHFATWSALVGPPGMQREVVNRLNAAINQALKQKDFGNSLASNGVIAWGTTPEELKSNIESEVNTWSKLAREANIQPE